jgi:hypothetical protein
MKVAAKWVRGRIGNAIDALLCGEAEVKVCVRVGYRASAVGDEALRIVDLVDQWSFVNPGDKVLDEVGIVVIEAPLGEVAHECWTGGRWSGLLGECFASRESEEDTEDHAKCLPTPHTLKDAGERIWMHPERALARYFARL